MADETIFGFTEQGFGNLQVLDGASIIEHADGTIDFVSSTLWWALSLPSWPAMTADGNDPGQHN